MSNNSFISDIFNYNSTFHWQEQYLWQIISNPPLKLTTIRAALYFSHFQIDIPIFYLSSQFLLFGSLHKLKVWTAAGAHDQSSMSGITISTLAEIIHRQEWKKLSENEHCLCTCRICYLKHLWLEEYIQDRK